MKILHVTSTLSPRFGGPTVVINEMARYEAKAGLDVTVISTNADYPEGLLDVPTDMPLYIEGVRYEFFPVQFRPLLVSLPMAVALKQRISAYDIVHIHGLYRFPPTFSASLCRLRGRPYIIRPHGSLDPYLYKQSSRSLAAKRLYERLFDLPNLNGASAIHYTTQAERSRARYLHLRSPALVLPNGLDRQRFEHLPAPGLLRRRFNLEGKEIVLFLGRINFVKGLDLLINAFARVAKDHPNAVLVIAGPDNDGYGRKVRNWITRRGIETRVFWQEMLLGTQVLQAYVDADLFVSASYSENFGMTVLEAMACGVPVVISNQTKIWQEVEKAEAGLVVPCRAYDLARALDHMLRNPEKRKKFGENGRSFVRSKFAWECVVKQLVRSYRAIVSSDEGCHSGTSRTFRSFHARAK